jgi:hypothetical protein
MTSFSEIKDVSWQCVHFAQPNQIDAIKEKLKSSPITTFELDASSIKDDDTLFAAISESLGFPDYFGCNWDALDECLSDLEWNEAEGYVLFVTGANKFWRDAAYTAGKLVSSWQLVAEQWSQEDIPFHLVFIL